MNAKLQATCVLVLVLFLLILFLRVNKYRALEETWHGDALAKLDEMYRDTLHRQARMEQLILRLERSQGTMVRQHREQRRLVQLQADVVCSFEYNYGDVYTPETDCLQHLMFRVCGLGRR